MSFSFKANQPKNLTVSTRASIDTMDWNYVNFVPKRFSKKSYWSRLNFVMRRARKVFLIVEIYWIQESYVVTVDGLNIKPPKSTSGTQNIGVIV